MAGAGEDRFRVTLDALERSAHVPVEEQVAGQPEPPPDPEALPLPEPVKHPWLYAG